MPVRTIENQAELMRHRARELLAGQRTAALNALRGHLAEIGVVAPQGAHHAYDLKRLAVDGFDEYGEVLLPDCVRVALRPLVCQIDALDEAIGAVDKEIAASVKADESRAPSRSCFLPASSVPGTSPCGSPGTGTRPISDVTTSRTVRRLGGWAACARRRHARRRHRRRAGEMPLRRPRARLRRLRVTDGNGEQDQDEQDDDRGERLSAGT